MSSLSVRVAAAALLVVASSCDRGATAPAPSGVSPSLTILAAPTAVDVVLRNTPLAAPLTVSAVIGALGGQINLPGAGLKVVVPAFAVTSATQFTITALAGNKLAYEFQPHGTRFLVPLVVTQNLVGTNALSGGLLPKPLIAGYFANVSDLDPLSATGFVTEVIGVSVSLVTKTATFQVFHFSGWLIATGKSSADTVE